MCASDAGAGEDSYEMSASSRLGRRCRLVVAAVQPLGARQKSGKESDQRPKLTLRHADDGDRTRARGLHGRIGVAPTISDYYRRRSSGTGEGTVSQTTGDCDPPNRARASRRRFTVQHTGQRGGNYASRFGLQRDRLVANASINVQV